MPINTIANLLKLMPTLAWAGPVIVLFMFMLSFIFVIVWNLFEWKGICGCFFKIIFAYICILFGDPQLLEWVEISLTTPYVCACTITVPGFLALIFSSLFEARRDSFICWYWCSYFVSLVSILWITSHIMVQVLRCLI